MIKYFCTACVFALCLIDSSPAQGQLKKKLGAAGRGAVIGKNSTDDSSDRRNDFEGTVWEYKIIDLKDRDQTWMTGRIRVKQSAVFAVGEVKVNAIGEELSAAEEAEQLMKKFDRDRNDQLDKSELTSLLSSQRSDSRMVKPSNGGAQGQGELRGLLNQRIKAAKADDLGGGERIGDFSKKNAKNCIFEFDQDDQYPLSGRAELKPDTKNKGGVWYGNYYEYVDGKKKDRWRIELRKIDE